MKKDVQKILTNSDLETKEFAKTLAQKLKSSGAIIALIGELGAGKTTFTQGFAEGLGVKDKIISPTFVLIRQHPIPDTKKTLHHIDLYRLDTPVNLNELGIADFIKEKNLILIEWADKILNQLPDSIIKIVIEKKGQSKRIISLS